MKYNLRLSLTIWGTTCAETWQESWCLFIQKNSYFDKRFMSSSTPYQKMAYEFLTKTSYSCTLISIRWGFQFEYIIYFIFTSSGSISLNSIPLPVQTIAAWFAGSFKSANRNCQSCSDPLLCIPGAAEFPKFEVTV